MAQHYRGFQDKLRIVWLRSFCIAFSFLPALLFVPVHHFQELGEHLPRIVFAALISVIGTWAAVASVNYLSIGVANTLLTAFSNVFIVATSVALLGENLSVAQVAIILLILVAVSLLGTSRSSGDLTIKHRPVRGTFVCILYGVFTGGAFVLLGVTSRDSHPLLVGYVWEALIGLCAGATCILRNLLCRDYRSVPSIFSVSSRTLISIFWRSAPTVLGTSCYALAMTYGSIAIASAILNLNMVASTLFAYKIYGENLSKPQWVWMFVLCVLVMGLRLAG